jgi:SNF2 family DNA or RNA helicase
LRPHQVIGANFVLRSLQGHLLKEDERCDKENPSASRGILVESRSDGVQIRYYAEAKVDDMPLPCHSDSFNDDDDDDDGRGGGDGRDNEDCELLNSESEEEDASERSAGGSSESSDEFFSELLSKSSGLRGVEDRMRSKSRSAGSASATVIYHGCILCDEMGLGKTIQALSVIAAATSPRCPQPDTNKTVRKALVVCPATLVDNWAKEVSKFFGPSFKPTVLHGGGSGGDKTALQSFLINRVPLLITSYETFRKFAIDINKVKYLEILVCDEGHRLKSSAGNKTIDALSACIAPRRLVLTGTPVQNDLDELYALVSFVCPGYLGTLPAYRRIYASVIEKGRAENASYDDKVSATKIAKVLRAKLANIMLRRTQEQILRNQLPPRRDYVLYIGLNKNQTKEYDGVCATMFHSIGEMDPAYPSRAHEATEVNLGVGPTTSVLPCLQKLRLLCTITVSPEVHVEEDVDLEQAPILKESSSTSMPETTDALDDSRDSIQYPVGCEEEGEDGGLQPSNRKASKFKSPMTSATSAMATAAPTVMPLTEKVPTTIVTTTTADHMSEKLCFLAAFLNEVQLKAPGEKVVVISNFTSVLYQVEKLASDMKWPALVLTGATKVADRQHMVDRFNSPNDKHFLFLLSAKAGGAGINLIGASRLISLDPDWNPATDQQAMARIWRQGQVKRVYIYRFIVWNSIETAIMDRQRDKGEISDEIMQAPKNLVPNSTKGFTKKDLIQLSRPHLANTSRAKKQLNMLTLQEGDDSVLTSFTGTNDWLLGVDLVRS